MIDLAHTPEIQSILDRWRMQLPVPVQIDESLMTKDHLRQLITMLIDAVESDHQLTRSSVTGHPSDPQHQSLTSDVCHLTSGTP